MSLLRLPALARPVSSAPESPDAPLLPRVARGEPGAVGECLARYGGLIWNLATRYLQNRADAEDAAQDVVIELWKSAHRFDPHVSSEATFVAVVARRRLIDWRRKLARGPEVGPLPEGLPGKESGPCFDRADDVARAVAAVDRLRDTPRRLLLMALVQGRTHLQIAEETGLPLGTVKAHIRRGLIAIRVALGASS